MDDDTLQKGQAAPLEGTLGKDIMMVLGIGFASMSLKACAQLGHAMSLGLMTEGPMQLGELSLVSSALTSLAGGPPSPSAAPAANPFMSGPKMSGPTGSA